MARGTMLNPIIAAGKISCPVCKLDIPAKSGQQCPNCKTRIIKLYRGRRNGLLKKLTYRSNGGPSTSSF